MKDREFRGVLTEEIKNKYGIASKEELRLIPYLQYLLVNQMPVDPRKVVKEERDVLSKWQQEGKITYSCNHPCTCSKEFWSYINDVLYDTYVLEMDEH